MGEGLHFATLATLVGKRNAVRWAGHRCTIGAVGWSNGRLVMGTLTDGTTVVGEPSDFTIPPKPIRGKVAK